MSLIDFGRFQVTDQVKECGENVGNLDEVE